MRFKKTLIFLLGGLFTLVALGVGAFFVDFDSPRLGQAVLDQVAHRTGMELRAQSFSLNLRRGLKLGQVEARSELPSGVLSLAAEELLLEHRLGPLLRGEVRIEEVRLLEPHVVLEERPAGRIGGREVPSTFTSAAVKEVAGASPEVATPTREPETRLKVGVTRIELEDGHLLYRPADPAAAPTEVHGLHLELRDLELDPQAPSPLLGLTAAGEIRAAEVKTGETRLAEPQGQVRMGGGHFLVEELVFATTQGHFVLSSLDVDLTRDPFDYSLAFAGDMDVESLLHGGAGGSLGAARLDFQASGEGVETTNLSGQGVLRVDTGTLPDVPLFAAIDRALGRAYLVGARYELFQVPFDVRRNRVHSEVFHIEAEAMAMAFSGWVSLDGALSLDLSLRLPRRDLDIEEIPKEVLDVLSDEEGRVALPIRIAGTVEAPRVKLRSDQLKEAAGRGVEREVRRELEKELGKALNKLFGNTG